jgi:hypothetical protein
MCFDSGTMLLTVRALDSSQGCAVAKHDVALLAIDCEPVVVVVATEAMKLGNDLPKQQNS